jgi:hypothetical protein
MASWKVAWSGGWKAAEKGHSKAGATVAAKDRPKVALMVVVWGDSRAAQKAA